MRSKSSSFNAGFQLDGPLGLDLSRATASSAVQSKTANFKIQIVSNSGSRAAGIKGAMMLPCCSIATKELPCNPCPPLLPVNVSPRLWTLGCRVQDRHHRRLHVVTTAICLGAASHQSAVWRVVGKSDRVADGRRILPMDKISFCPNGRQQKVAARRAFPQPDDGDSAGNFLLAALSAKRLCRDGRALTPVPDRSASPRMMPTLQP